MLRGMLSGERLLRGSRPSQFRGLSRLKDFHRELCISGNTGENESPSAIAANSSGPRRCATRVAAFVLIVRRMIHGALRYGDHPRNILSSRLPTPCLRAYPPAPRWKDTGWKVRVLARYGE